MYSMTKDIYFGGGGEITFIGGENPVLIKSS